MTESDSSKNSDKTASRPPRLEDGDAAGDKPTPRRRRSASQKADLAQQFFDILGRRYPLPFIDEDVGGTKERILMTATLLFARKGYAAVSVRDIAKANGVKPPSLYNHFAGKEGLWTATLAHIEKLYFLYFDQLSLELGRAETFKEALAIIFQEPKRLANIFTCYGFSLIMVEQVRDETAARIFESFMSHGARIIKEKLESLAARRGVAGFNAHIAAVIIMNNTFMGLLAKVQELQGRKPAYRAEDMFAEMEDFIWRTTGEEAAAGALP